MLEATNEKFHRENRKKSRQQTHFMDDRLQRNFAMSMRLLQSDRLTSGPANDAAHAASSGWHRGRQLASPERDEKLAVCQQR